MNKQIKKSFDFYDLLLIMNQLRSEQGCPWDKEQTHESLKANILEESYEVVEAINNKDFDNLAEELGDILLQVVFHAAIANENHKFDINDVIRTLCEKLIRRHPHVFSNISLKNSNDVIDQWEIIKKQEKNFTTTNEVLKAVPKALPALVRATKVQNKAAKVGFDFKNFEEALKKVYEELDELVEANNTQDNILIEEEFGDFLFSAVNIARFININAEISLTNATEKFINRFEGLESMVLKQGKKLSDMSLDELDMLWGRIKQSNV